MGEEEWWKKWVFQDKLNGKVCIAWDGEAWELLYLCKLIPNSPVVWLGKCCQSAYLCFPVRLLGVLFVQWSPFHKRILSSKQIFFFSSEDICIYQFCPKTAVAGLQNKICIQSRDFHLGCEILNLIVTTYLFFLSLEKEDFFMGALTWNCEKSETFLQICLFFILFCLGWRK